MSVWPEVVGPIIAAKTRPLHINRGVLTLQVQSAPWAHQLNLFKAQFLTTIAQKVGPQVVQDLRWRIGTLQPESASPGPVGAADAAAKTSNEELPALENFERQAIDTQVRVIADPRLAARIASTLEARRRRERWLREQGWSPCQRCGCLHDPTPASPAWCPICQQQT